MAHKLGLDGKTVFVTGGSAGLGLEISKAAAAQGANVTMLARRQKVLDEAQKSIEAVRLRTSQEIRAVSVNLASAPDVEAVYRSQPCLPDYLFCCAGGTPSQTGFIKDISPEQLQTCMQNNYLTAAFSSQLMLKLWAEEHAASSKSSAKSSRHIIFINSVAAFCTVPGMGAYSAPKCAVRGLADCLRMEALVYSSPVRTYSIHSAFPSTFISDAFFQEQKGKPSLTMEIEGTVGTDEDMIKKHPSAEKMADIILSALANGDFAICDKSVESPLLFANMVGVTPKRGWGIWDTIVSIVMAVAWPLFGQKMWDGLCRDYSQKYHEEQRDG